MLQTTDFDGHDGTRLRAYFGGNPDGPPLVIANGLGGSIRSWRHVVNAFEGDYRIVSWDYRGLYGSGWPADGRAFEVQDQALDLGLLLDHFDVEQPVILGWSMGVQVTLEFLRHSQDRVAGFVAMHGTSGMPLATAFDGRTPRRFAPFIYKAVRRIWRLAMKPAPALASRRAFSSVFVGGGVRLGIMEPTLDRDVFWDMGQDWVQLNLDHYCSLFEALDRHSAHDLLPDLNLPTLVVNGGRDRFTPPELGEEMARQIPGAEVFTLPGGTHFGLIEHPEAVNRRLRRFLDDKISLTTT
jgi:pimeloyl-ACP methyl ester carboxylesterase